MKKLLLVSVVLLLSKLVSSQEVAKEEIGNVKYLSDQIVDEKLEKQRFDRQQELLNSPELFKPGKRHTYQGNDLEAIEFPIGAFGGGHLIMDGSGNLKHWKIFNNGELSFIPNSFFAVKVREGKNKPLSRVLQTNKVGPFEAMDKLTFQGEYPFAWLKFTDDEMPVELSMEAYNPFIPMDLKNSAIPCAIFKLTAHNPTDKKIDVSFLYAQQNAVGYRTINQHGGKNSSREFFKNDTEFIDLNKVNDNSFEGYGQNVNKVYNEKRHTYVHLSSLKKDTLSGKGDMVFGTIGETAEATASWEDLNKLHSSFTNSELTKIRTTQASKEGETHSAAISKSFVLKAGESRTVVFYLAWHFPYGDRGSYAKNAWGRGKWGGYGNMYSNWWSNAIDVSNYLQNNYSELEEKTKLYHESFYKSNFPYWLKDRITAQTSIMKTNTMFWDKDGYIGGWEGISPRDGACSGNCTHVWHYAQANARLFPEMGRRMREQSFSFMKDNGMLPYRHPNGHEAFDGQCGEIIQVYREHLLSENMNFLNQHYPKVVKALDFIIKTWDSDKDGVLEGAKHNTLDSRLGGNSSWHGSLYAAALLATAEMASLKGESEYAESLKKLSKKAIDSHLNTLWNGEYFIQIPDSQPRADYLTGCATDQLLGQWWANQLQLGKLYPEKYERKTLESIFKYNFKGNFLGLMQNPREFVKADEAGLLMITWPHGGRPKPHTSYA
ncbi:MAG: GH116 family glycosyl-hydrolase, partial [Carboxylicivirga sp.]|nr:GH116 family glycosyl-hydrolase [Carboxylicivirga sp.]